MKSLKQLIEEKQQPEITDKRISQEFQDYAYRLMNDLGDQTHRGIYFRMVKTVDRAILEQARQFVIDSNATNRAALFMWKVKEIRKTLKTKI